MIVLFLVAGSRGVDHAQAYGHISCSAKPRTWAPPLLGAAPLGPGPKPCLACGACCFSELSSYVRVTGTDHARLGERALALADFDGNQAFMRMQDGHCAALILDRATSQWWCTVYDTRPEVCRALERGSAECSAERSAAATTVDQAPLR